MSAKVSPRFPVEIIEIFRGSITDGHRFRLRSACDELTVMLSNEKDLEEKDEYIKALAVIKEAKIQLD